MARRRGQTETEALLALPHTQLVDGRTYVRIDYRNVDGKWRSKTRRVDTVEEAVRAMSQIRLELGLSDPSALDGEALTFDQLLIVYARRHPHVARHYLDLLRRSFGRKRIRAITYSDLKRFKAERETVRRADGSNRKPATINHEIECLRGALLFALRHGLLEKDPFRDGPKLIVKDLVALRRRASPTPEEEACILAQCVGPRERLAALIIATRDTGLGKKDLFALAWRNVDFVDRLLLLPVGRQRFRLIGLTARLLDELRRRWLRSERKPDLKVFGELKDFRSGYRTVCRLVGVPYLRFCDLAKGFAADLAAAGVPPKMAKERVGLIDPETGEIAPNLDQRNARRIAEAIDALHLARLRSAYECSGRVYE